MYAEWLFERREFADAALGTNILCLSACSASQIFFFPLTVFVQAHRPQKALVAYERALDWQALFVLAVRERVDTVEMKDMGYRVAGAFVFCFFFAHSRL